MTKKAKSMAKEWPPLSVEWYAREVDRCRRAVVSAEAGVRIEKDNLKEARRDLDLALAGLAVVLREPK